MISLDNELDRMNKTMHIADKIYSGIHISHRITSSEADRQGSWICLQEVLFYTPCD